MSNNKVVLGKKYSNINKKLQEKRNLPISNDIKEVACTSIENVLDRNVRRKVVRNNDAYEQARKEVAATYYKK